MEVKIASAQGLADCKKLLMLAKGAERARSQLDTMVTDLVERRMDL